MENRSRRGQVLHAQNVLQDYSPHYSHSSNLLLADISIYEARSAATVNQWSSTEVNGMTIYINWRFGAWYLDYFSNNLVYCPKNFHLCIDWTSLLLPLDHRSLSFSLQKLWIIPFFLLYSHVAHVCFEPSLCHHFPVSNCRVHNSAVEFHSGLKFGRQVLSLGAIFKKIKYYYEVFKTIQVWGENC